MTTHAHHAGEFGPSRRAKKKVKPPKTLKKAAPVEYSGKNAAYYHSKMKGAQAKAKLASSTSDAAAQRLLAAKHAKKVMQHAKIAMKSEDSIHKANAQRLHDEAKGLAGSKVSAKTESLGEKKSKPGKAPAKGTKEYSEFKHKLYSEKMNIAKAKAKSHPDGAERKKFELEAAKHAKSVAKHEKKLKKFGVDVNSDAKTKEALKKLGEISKPTAVSDDRSSGRSKVKALSDTATDAGMHAQSANTKSAHEKAAKAHMDAHVAATKANLPGKALLHKDESEYHQKKANNLANNVSDHESVVKEKLGEKVTKEGPFKNKYPPAKVPNQSSIEYNPEKLMANAQVQSKSKFAAERGAFTGSLHGKHDQMNALLHYSGAGYEKINGTPNPPPNGLRKAQNGGMDASTAKTIKAMDDAIASHPAKMDMVTHRGVGGKNFYKRFKAGDHIVEHGFSSTSAGGKAAFGSSEVALTVYVPKGHPAAPIPSKHAHENEILLPRGTRFKIMKDPEMIDGKLHVHLAIVAHDESHI